MTFVASGRLPGRGRRMEHGPWRFSFALCHGRSEAQLGGSHALMAWGPKSETQPPLAAVLALTYANWDVNNIVDRNGNGTPTFDLSLTSLGLFAWVVTPKKVLGGSYGFQLLVPCGRQLPGAAPPRVRYQFVARPFGHLCPAHKSGMAHTSRADYMAGFPLSVSSTGNDEPNGNENKGLGMWSFELSGEA